MTSIKLVSLLVLARLSSAIRSHGLSLSNMTAETSVGQHQRIDREVSTILVSGWALRCSESCNPRGKPATIVKLDELDTQSVRLVYVLYSQDSKWVKIKYCNFNKRGTCNVKGRLTQQSHLFPLPLKDGRKDELIFRGSAVSSFEGIFAKLQTEFSSDGTYTGWLFGSPTEWLAQKALADTFINTFTLQQEGLLPKVDEFKDEILTWLAEERLRIQRGKELQSRLAQAVPLLVSLRSTILSRLETLPHNVYKCGINLADASALSEAQSKRMQLDRSSKAHRLEQRESLKDLAFQTFGVVFATLTIVADAALPMSGSIATIAQQATAGATKVVRTFAEPEFISTLVAASKQLQTVSNGALPDVSATLPTELDDPAFLEISAATESGALEEALDQLKGEIVEISKSGKQVTVGKSLEASKAILWSIMKASATEGAWTAASYIPIICPYVSLVRSMLGLSHTLLDMGSTHVDYLKWKDPIIRSMFRLRDCQLAILLETPIEAVSVSSKPLELQEAAIRTAIDAGVVALTLNQDLATRLRKKSTFESAGAHEESVMLRLNSGQTRWYVGTTLQVADENDAYLPANELRPGEWQNQLEELISNSKARIDTALSE